MTEFHPGYILLMGAVLAAVLPWRLRQAVMILAPLGALLAVFGLEIGAMHTFSFINQIELIPLKIDELSWIFAFIFALITLLANIFALHNKSAGEAAAALAYAGGALGVVLAGDWLTLIFFWEFMAVSSTLLIWFKKSPQAVSAGFRYLLVHFFGGNLLLAGIFLKATAGETAITALTGTGDAAYWLILTGIAVNAAIPPLHAWLTDAYPEASATGSVFLSAYTTKVAVYCLIRVFPGTQLLIWAGTIMAIYGIIYAVLENDIRRLLGYHIICQVGYMVAAAGIGTELALNGAVAHAFNNILYKSLLFMAAGALISSTGLTKLSDLGGIFRKSPAVVFLYMIAAFSISGMPLFSGFISKAMVISAATYSQIPTVELLLYLSSVGTFLSMVLKIPYLAFFGPERGIEPVKIPLNMYVAMGASAFLCILYGVFPQLLYQWLPFNASYDAYTADHVISTIQLQAAVLPAFWLLAHKFTRESKISLDTDWFYRKPLVFFVSSLAKLACSIRDGAGVLGNKALQAIMPVFANPLRWAADCEGEFCPIYQEDRCRFPVGVPLLMSILVFIAAASIMWLKG